MSRLSIHTIREAHQAVEKAQRLNDTAERLCRKLETGEDIEKVGMNVKSMLGQNLMFNVSATLIGEVTVCGVVNALMKERQYIVDQYSEIVDLPQNFCVEQHPSQEID